MSDPLHCQSTDESTVSDGSTEESDSSRQEAATVLFLHGCNSP